MSTMTEINVPKTIVLIGMMGVGKTSIGKRLAKRLNFTFTDSDHEVELAAKCSVADIFEIYGEAAFHDVERRVIKRLLDESNHVLATGGTAFANDETHELVKKHGISIWLQADIETLIPRIERRDHRPQFATGDTRETLTQLMAQFEGYYSKADIKIDCNETTPETTTDKIILELNRYLSKQQMESGKKIQHV